MKIPKLLYSCLFLVAASWATTTLSASPTLDFFFRQSDSSLPLAIAQSNTGKINSAHAFETSDRLYIAGSVRPFILSPSTHVDVQLIGQNGQILAEKKDGIVPAHPRTARGRNGSYSYVSSFPLGLVHRATGVRVVYRNNSHSKCPTPGKG